MQQVYEFLLPRFIICEVLVQDKKFQKEICGTRDVAVYNKVQNFLFVMTENQELPVFLHNTCDLGMIFR